MLINDPDLERVECFSNGTQFINYDEILDLSREWSSDNGSWLERIRSQIDVIGRQDDEENFLSSLYIHREIILNYRQDPSDTECWNGIYSKYRKKSLRHENGPHSVLIRLRDSIHPEHKRPGFVVDQNSVVRLMNSLSGYAAVSSRYLFCFNPDYVHVDHYVESLFSTQFGYWDFFIVCRGVRNALSQLHPELLINASDVSNGIIQFLIKNRPIASEDVSNKSSIITRFSFEEFWARVEAGGVSSAGDIYSVPSRGVMHILSPNNRNLNYNITIQTAREYFELLQGGMDGRDFGYRHSAYFRNIYWSIADE